MCLLSCFSVKLNHNTDTFFQKIPQDDDGLTPLLNVVKNKDIPNKKEILDLLIQSGAEVNEKNTNDLDKSPMHYAARYGQTDIMELLIKAEADLNARDNYLSTPAHIAAANNKPSILDLLQTAGADFTLKNDYNDTPAHWAARNGSKECVDILVRGGADPHAKTTKEELLHMKQPSMVANKF